MKTIRLVGGIATLMLASALAATAAEPDRLDSDVGDAIQMFRSSGHRIQRLFDSAYGYAIFPSVGKGAVGIGAAEGRGQVYEKGVLVGTAKLTQVTVGAQLGGQSYAEVIFFETPRALDEFKDGKTAISAALSAVAAGDGASAEAKYQHGVLVYTMENSGLMFEASVGGQHFSFTPLATSSPAPAPTQAPPAGSAAPTATPPASAPPSQTPTR
jgi:lipid-binding SYLF domain-containing protein